MSSFILIDELIEFTNELIELMKEDWKKFKIFIKEYKKYMFWILVLFITMQFTDLMSLGTSWERYCKKNGNSNNSGTCNDSSNDISNDKKRSIQNGGSNDAAGNTGNAAESDIPSPDPVVPQTKKQFKQSRRSSISQTARHKAFGSSSESKDIDKKIQWFKNLRGQMTGNLGSGAGPVFGNFDRIFKYMEALFIVVTSLLIIVGVISLPVLIFIIVAYCVLKKMVRRFTIL